MAARGWVLYDGDCGFCRRWVGRWKPVLERYGFRTAPLQTPWVVEKLGDSPDLLQDIRVLTPAGESVRAEFAYLYVAKRIWWLWPLGMLFSLPGLRHLTGFVYRWFARNRYCISGACGLDSRRPSSGRSS